MEAELPFLTAAGETRRPLVEEDLEVRTGMLRVKERGSDKGERALKCERLSRSRSTVEKDLLQKSRCPLFWSVCDVDAHFSHWLD